MIQRGISGLLTPLQSTEKGDEVEITKPNLITKPKIRSTKGQNDQDFRKLSGKKKIPGILLDLIQEN